MAAGDDLHREEKKLKAILKQAAGLPGIDGNALRELQAAWADFADRHAGLVASQVEGGSMYPLLWASAKVALVRDRVTQLEGIIDGWME